MIRILLIIFLIICIKLSLDYMFIEALIINSISLGMNLSLFIKEIRDGNIR
jgi:hypothetical protein